MSFERQTMPLILQLAREARRAADASLGPGDLRHTHVLTLHVLDRRGPMSQQDLGEVLGLDPSNVVLLLNEIEDRGLTTRRRDPTDRRRHIVELTPDGGMALKTAQARLAAVEDALLGALNPEERGILREMLERVTFATTTSTTSKA